MIIIIEYRPKFCWRASHTTQLPATKTPRIVLLDLGIRMVHSIPKYLLMNVGLCYGLNKVNSKLLIRRYVTEWKIIDFDEFLVN